MEECLDLLQHSLNNVNMHFVSLMSFSGLTVNMPYFLNGLNKKVIRVIRNYSQIKFSC